MCQKETNLQVWWWFLKFLKVKWEADMIRLFSSETSSYSLFCFLSFFYCKSGTLSTFEIDSGYSELSLLFCCFGLRRCCTLFLGPLLVVLFLTLHLCIICNYCYYLLSSVQTYKVCIFRMVCLSKLLQTVKSVHRKCFMFEFVACNISSDQTRPKKTDIKSQAEFKLSFSFVLVCHFS